MGTGVGHDPAKEFTSSWWDDAYKQAANNVIIDSEQDGTVKVNIKKTSKEKKKEKKNALNSQYSAFVQSATLDGGKLISKNENSDEDEENVDEKSNCVDLTDEELFKACGGLTAHKGARHGHKMSAKQKRIEEQEQELLKEMEKSYGVVPNQKSSQVEESQKTSKKRGCSEDGEFEKSENDCKSAKKKQKSQTEIEQPLSDFQDQPEKSETESKVSKKEKEEV